MCPRGLESGRRIVSHRSTVSDPTESTIRSDVQQRCRRHPGATARWVCEGCRQYWCPACVKVLPIADVTTAACRGCSARCVEYRCLDLAHRRVSRGQDFAEALAYPWAGAGRWIVVAGSVSVLLLGIALAIIGAILPMSGVVVWALSWTVQPLALAYLLVHLLQTCRRTMTTPDEPYDWPDVRSLGESILLPALQIAFVIALCSAPAIFLALFEPAFWFAGVALRAAVLPALILSLALHEDGASIWPGRWLPLIRRGGGAYWQAALLCAVAETVLWLVPGIGQHLLFPALITAVVLYVGGVAARRLGHVGRRLLEDGIA